MTPRTGSVGASEGATRAFDTVRERNATDNQLLLAVVVAHLLLTIPLAASLNIWIDEAYTLQSTGSGVRRAVERALNFELQPPLYFIVLALWRTIDESLFFARLLSILCTAATVWTIGTVSRRFLPAVPPALVGAVVAFNPLTVYAAVEARFYALTLLLCALLLRFFHDAYLHPQPGRGARRAYAVLGIVGLYTSYFTGFILAAGAMALIATPRRNHLQDYLVRMLIIGAAFAPLAVLTVQQVAAIHAVGITQTPSVFDGARHVWGIAWRQLLPTAHDSLFADARRWGALAVTPLLMLALVLRRNRLSAELLSAVVLATVVAAFYVMPVTRFGVEFLRPFHGTVLYLPVVLGALSATIAAAGGTVARAVALISICCAAITLVDAYSALAKPGDWIRVSRYIERHESTSEPILVFRGEYALPLKHHYRGKNSVIPLPRLMDEERYDPGTQALHSKFEVAEKLERAPQPGNRFWLVTGYTGVFRGVDVHPEFAEAFVSECCVTVREISLHQVRIRQLEFRDTESDGRP